MHLRWCWSEKKEPYTLPKCAFDTIEKSKTWSLKWMDFDECHKQSSKEKKEVMNVSEKQRGQELKPKMKLKLKNQNDCRKAS